MDVAVYRRVCAVLREQPIYTRTRLIIYCACAGHPIHTTNVDSWQDTDQQGGYQIHLLSLIFSDFINPQDKTPIYEISEITDASSRVLTNCVEP
jgi:hypothetical protein